MFPFILFIDHPTASCGGVPPGGGERGLLLDVVGIAGLPNAAVGAILVPLDPADESLLPQCRNDRPCRHLGTVAVFRDGFHGRPALALLPCTADQEAVHHFVLLFLDWKYRLDKAWYLGYEFPQNYLQVEHLDVMPDNLERLQRQALELLTHIWAEDDSDKSVDEKMTAYYLEAEQAGTDVFRFRPQKMSYELMYREIFAEVLCPDTVYGLIDFHLRECLKREIKMRRCKNCGRLFAVTGHGGTEYCDRPADEKGRTCKEIGAFRVWKKSKSADETFKVFRREYKKRFA